MKTIIGFLIAISTPALASTVAVVDSGTDFQHEKIAGHEWINAREVAGNFVDDDGNGKVDDVVGWNFVDKYDRVFFPEHLKKVNPITYRMFEIIAHQQAGIATDDEKKYWAANVTSLPQDRKTALVAHLNFYGQYAHSTHCSGIIVAQNPQAKIMSARVFADQPPEQYTHDVSGARMMMAGGPKMGLMDFIYKLLALVTNGTFGEVGKYLKENSVDVANYSLGVPLKTLAKQMLVLRGHKEPTDAELATETRRMFTQYEPQGKAWIEGSPNTLFVIAAGNDGSDNEVFPTFPANVRTANAITVAASQGVASLASFSNYGKTTVDVAAPGVAVMSSVPSLDEKAMLPMSGTSMAAPYVTGLASRIKDLNPKLTPAQIKEILMGTVDAKAWLKDKVVAGGVVNSERAFMAADHSRTMSVAEAVRAARGMVRDQEVVAVPARISSNTAPADLRAMADSLVF